MSAAYVRESRGTSVIVLLSLLLILLLLLLVLLLMRWKAASARCQSPALAHADTESGMELKKKQ
jgi:hypothetical protein